MRGCVVVVVAAALRSTALLSSGFKAGLIDPNAVLPGPAQMVQLLAAATRDLKPILIE
jgi:hypothetical protein